MEDFLYNFLHLYCRKCGTHKRMQIGEIKKEKCKYIFQLIVAVKMEFFSTKNAVRVEFITIKVNFYFCTFLRGSQFLKLCLLVCSQVNR